MKKRSWPTWTVIYNIIRPNAAFVGKGWEFFSDKDCAQYCYDKLITLGNVPTMRPFHPSDKQHMNPIDSRGCSDT